jgi:hypothetical protein
MAATTSSHKGVIARFRALTIALLNASAARFQRRTACRPRPEYWSGGVGLMAKGLPSRGVAARLGISYTTVRTHMRSVGSKLGVHSRLEAIVKAWELGLTT